MISEYMILLNSSSNSYPEKISILKKEKVNPSPMDNFGISYHHIFWNLNSPKEFLDKKPEYKGKKLIAIKISKDTIIPGIKTIVHDESGLQKIIYRACEKEDSLDVSKATFFDLDNL
jgi:hypothetical protein